MQHMGTEICHFRKKGNRNIICSTCIIRTVQKPFAEEWGIHKPEKQSSRCNFAMVIHKWGKLTQLLWPASHPSWRIAVCLACSSLLAACHLFQWTQALFRDGATRASEAWSTQKGGDCLHSVRPSLGEDNRKCYISFNLLSFKQIRALESEQIPFFIWSYCLFCICNLHLKWPWCALGNKPSSMCQDDLRELACTVCCGFLFVYLKGAFL